MSRNTAEEEQAPEAAPPSQEKIHLGDTPSLKRALDTAAIEVAKSAGLKINNLYTDTKITLGILACLVALIGQFWPAKFPENYTILTICVITYIILSTTLTLFSLLIEKDTVALTYPTETHPALNISSSMRRYQEKYILTLQLKDSTTDKGVDNKGAGRKQECWKLEKSVGTYFDEEGVLAKEVFEKDVLKLLKEAEKYGGKRE